VAIDVATLGEPGGRGTPERDEGLDGRGAFAGASTLPIGVAYYRLRSSGAAPLEDGGTGRLSTLETGHLAVALVQSLGAAVTVGAALKWVHGEAATGTSSGPPADWLDEARPRPAGQRHLRPGRGRDRNRGRARFGLVGRNLRQPSFSARGGGSLELARQVRAGVAWRAGPQVLLAADADLTSTDTPLGEKRHLAAGVEWQVLPAALVLRGGARASTVDDAAPAGSAGSALPCRTASGWTPQITLGATRGSASWGVAGRLAF